MKRNFLSSNLLASNLSFLYLKLLQDPLIDLNSSEFDIADNAFEESLDASRDEADVFEHDGNYVDRSDISSTIGITENHVYDLTNEKSQLTREDVTTGLETPPLDNQESIPSEQLRRMSIELVSNRMFREIGDRITKLVL